MAGALFSNQTFQSQTALEPGEYEDCIFADCQLAGINLSSYVFDHCQWVRCDLSNVVVQETAFRNNSFDECKLLGIHFEDVNTFSLSLHFKDCILNYASFFQLKIPGTEFLGCKMEEVNLEEADLRRAVFRDCMLVNSSFSYANLEEADFRTALQFSINPEHCKLKGARFSRHNLEGLLVSCQIRIEP
jgi:uncharacterized protein YjbI with pentapeptide repeats